MRFHFQTDSVLGTLGTPEGADYGFAEGVLVRSARQALYDNNPVGVATGRGDECLSFASVTGIFLTNLDFTVEQFESVAHEGLMALMIDSKRYPFSRESFLRSQSGSCVYMRNAHGVPVLMEIVKKDVTAENGERQWVLAIRRCREAEMMEGAGWSADFRPDHTLESVHWSDSFRRLLGFETEEEFPDEAASVRTRLHPADAARVTELFEVKVAQSGQGNFASEEFRMRTKAGRYEWFRCTVSVLRRTDNTVCRIIGNTKNITEEKMLDAQEARHEAVMRAFSEGNMAEFFVDLRDGRVEVFKMPHMGGVESQRIKTWQQLVTLFAEHHIVTDHHAAFTALSGIDRMLERLQRTPGGYSEEFPLECHGNKGWVSCTVLPGDSDKEGGLLHAYVYFRDITKAKAGEAERRRLTADNAMKDELLRGVSRTVKRFAVAELDKNSYMYYTFDQHDLRYSPVGEYTGLLATMDQHLTALRDNQPCPMSEVLDRKHLKAQFKDSDDVFRFDYCTKDQSAFMVMSVVPLQWEAGHPNKVLLVAEDSTQKHLLETLANTDSLTGLLNARNLSNTLKKWSNDQAFALFYMDLDGFKDVNDRYGHDVGDQLLQIVGARLRKCVRMQDKVFRVGGDEFCILVPGYHSAAGCQEIAARIKNAVSQPCRVADSILLHIGTSCGFARWPGETETPDEVRSLADHRMYFDKAKRRAQSSRRGRHLVKRRRVRVVGKRRVRRETN